jgi:hypothetical protein
MIVFTMNVYDMLIYALKCVFSFSNNWWLHYACLFMYLQFLVEH